jgi:hypothetical protein
LESKMSVKTKTVNEVSQMLQDLIEDGHGEDNLLIGIPFRNGVGLHYEGVKNISFHSGIVDLLTTCPDSDDIKDRDRV